VRPLKLRVANFACFRGEATELDSSLENRRPEEFNNCDG
jgi:hypothetical protein